MDSIDRLLSQIKDDNRELPKTPKLPKDRQPTVDFIQPNSDIDSLLAEVEADRLNLPATSNSSIDNSPIIDNILSQVKANYHEQDRVRAQNEQQQLQAEQLKRIEKLKLQAKDWLKQLDPLSTEGLWFERFAEGYPTKLEAAINYLQSS